MKAIPWAVLGLSVCVAASAFGEDIILPDSSGFAQSEPLLDPGATDTSSNDAPLRAPAAALPPVLEQPSLDDLAASVKGKRAEQKWRVIPFGRFKVTADDNISISHTDQQSDVSFNLSPGIALGWGDYSAEIRQLGEFEHYFEALNLETDDNPQSFLFAKYVANAAFFVDHGSEDALDHDALLAGRWEMAKLTLGLRLHYQTLSGTDIDVGDRVKRKIYSGAITSLYHLSDKVSLELNVYNSTYDYQNQVDYSEWTLEDWANYQILPKTKISLGTRLGTVDIKTGTTETYEQLVARIAYYASSKLGFSLDGGVEWRQYGDGGGDDLFTVFNFAATYSPFDGTQISGNAFRRNSASVSLINENITSTGLSARLRQRFLHRFYFTVEGGYQNSEYHSIQTGNTAGRNDDRVYLKPSISFDVTKYLSAETAYQFQRNDSSVESSTFQENIVTFQVNLQF